MRVFSETQKFTQWWLKLIYVMLLALVAYGFYTWYILGEALGNVAKDDITAQAIFTFSILIPIAIMYLFKLKTAVDEIGIHYQFLPFHLSKKNIRWTDIEKCYARTYSPIGEYGGWGLRGSFGKNKAYNIRGNKGIQTVLKSGEKLLIGTQKENEAQKVINRYFKN